MDFATPAKILAALGSEKEVRREYSRQRSIVRKRVERMKAAGETTNEFYSRFGDLDKALPTARGLSTKEMLARMTASARAIAGGYNSTLTKVRESRESAVSSLADQAREVGDIETAEALEKGLTPKQYEKVGKLWGIVRKVMGKSIGKTLGSGDMNLAIATKVVQGGRSLLSMAAELINDFGGTTQDMEEVQARFTQTGKQRVSWTKAHGGKKARKK